jgi:hypothetical protein
VDVKARLRVWPKHWIVLVYPLLDDTHMLLRPTQIQCACDKAAKTSQSNCDKNQHCPKRESGVWCRHGCGVPYRLPVHGNSNTHCSVHATPCTKKAYYVIVSGRTLGLKNDLRVVWSPAMGPLTPTPATVEVICRWLAVRRAVCRAVSTRAISDK